MYWVEVQHADPDPKIQKATNEGRAKRMARSAANILRRLFFFMGTSSVLLYGERASKTSLFAVAWSLTAPKNTDGLLPSKTSSRREWLTATTITGSASAATLIFTAPSSAGAVAPIDTAVDTEGRVIQLQRRLRPLPVDSFGNPSHWTLPFCSYDPPTMMPCPGHNSNAISF